MSKCLSCGTHHLNDNWFCSKKCEQEMVGDFYLPEQESKKVDGGGKRFNTGKLPIDLVPTSSIYALADVLEYGATKYDDHNWRRGMKWSVPYSCAMRHLLKWFEGEERDEESGREHLSHVMANIAMLIEFSTTCKELDDRFKGSQRRYDSFDKPVSKPLRESDLDNMAKEFDSTDNNDCENDPETYCNGRT